MHNKKLDAIIVQVENYLECWKQFNSFLVLARGKKFSAEDENQFLEVKSIIVQELELISASFEGGFPGKEDVHTLVGSASSLRALSETNEGTLRGLEGQWHKIYVSLQALLGQLKVQQRDLEGKGFFSSMFGGKKK